VERRYVGIDLHRRRSVIYTMGVDGEKLDSAYRAYQLTRAEAPSCATQAQRRHSRSRCSTAQIAGSVLGPTAG
jgi:hypothetical protein